MDYTDSFSMVFIPAYPSYIYVCRERLLQTRLALRLYWRKHRYIMTSFLDDILKGSQEVKEDYYQILGCDELSTVWFASLYFLTSFWHFSQGNTCQMKTINVSQHEHISFPLSLSLYYVVNACLLGYIKVRSTSGSCIISDCASFVKRLCLFQD